VAVSWLAVDGIAADGIAAGGAAARGVVAGGWLHRGWLHRGRLHGGWRLAAGGMPGTVDGFPVHASSQRVNFRAFERMLNAWTARRPPYRIAPSTAPVRAVHRTGSRRLRYRITPYTLPDRAVHTIGVRPVHIAGARRQPYPERIARPPGYPSTTASANIAGLTLA
jgi:hypothetical protein